MRWYLKAAEQGHRPAQNNLGFMYANGEGVPQDNTEAVRWYLKAAEQGDPIAQYNLGGLFYEGEGISKDNLQAYAWFSIAAASGHNNSQVAREIVAMEMSSTEIFNAQILSRKLWDAIGLNNRGQ